MSFHVKVVENNKSKITKLEAIASLHLTKFEGGNVQHYIKRNKCSVVLKNFKEV